VAHNAAFDRAFINMELGLCRRAHFEEHRFVDTLMLARRRHPNGPNSLDALCARYGIDSSSRTLHGALLDAQILAEVYLELLGGRQATLALSSLPSLAERAAIMRPVGARPRALPARLTPETSAPTALSSWAWGRPALAALRAGRTAAAGELTRRSALRRCRSLLNADLGHALAVERREVDRVDHQRGKAALARRVGKDLPGEWKQEPRALDQEERVHVLLRHVADLEQAA
jgi:DNA polymerase III epsilon subunit-like protein